MPPLHPRYSLDTLIVGVFNGPAFTAAVAAVERPAELHHLLFLYGDIGLGKTHLLQAIGHLARSRTPGAGVLYTTCAALVAELVRGLQTGRVEEVRARYSLPDLLLVDDMQCTDGKEDTQEEILGLISARRQARKQIVLTADRHPLLIAGLGERLQTQHAGHPIVVLHAPDLEARKAILEEKVREQAVPVPPEVTDLIARRVQRSIRALEGALTGICGRAVLTGVPVTVELAERVLAPVSGPDAPHAIGRSRVRLLRE